MGISIPGLGSMSLYFFVGCITSLSAVMLRVGIKTNFYTKVFDAIQTSSVTSLLIAAPFVVLLGIFVNMFRIAVFRHLLKRQSYDFSGLPGTTSGALKETIAAQLSIDQDEVNLQDYRQFESTKQLLLPEMDEFAIRARWLHDLFENTILVASYSLVVLGFRAIVFGFEGIDWALLLGSIFAGFLAALSIPHLRRTYTICEVSLVVNIHSLHKSKKENRGSK